MLPHHLRVGPNLCAQCVPYAILSGGPNHLVCTLPTGVEGWGWCCCNRIGTRADHKRSPCVPMVADVSVGPVLVLGLALLLPDHAPHHGCGGISHWCISTGQLHTSLVCASTSGLSTQSSAGHLKGELILKPASRLDAFSGYPSRT